MSWFIKYIAEIIYYVMYTVHNVLLYISKDLFLCVMAKNPFVHGPQRELFVEKKVHGWMTAGVRTQNSISVFPHATSQTNWFRIPSHRIVRLLPI